MSLYFVCHIKQAIKWNLFSVGWRYANFIETNFDSAPYHLDKIGITVDIFESWFT